MYRPLLYCNDINVSNPWLAKGFLSACYKIPLSLPYRYRKHRSTIARIPTTSSGVSTDHVLDYDISNIMKGETDRLTGEDTNLSSIHIFIDFCCYLGEHPASSEGINVMRYSGDVVCPFCSFRYQDTIWGPYCTYRAEQSSRHVSFTGYVNCSILIWSHGLSAQHTHFLGMKKTHSLISRDKVMAFVYAFYGAKQEPI